MPPGGNGRGPQRPRTPSRSAISNRPNWPAGRSQAAALQQSAAFSQPAALPQPAGAGADAEQARSSGAKPNGSKSPPAAADRQRLIKPTPGAGARAGSGESPTSQPLPRRDRVDAPVVRHRSASSLPLDPP